LAELRQTSARRAEPPHPIDERQRHWRAGLRYGSDLTDAEWAIVAPRLPKLSDRGRRRRWHWRGARRDFLCAEGAGCPWRFLSDSFQPWRTVYRGFGEVRDARVFENLNHHLFQMDRARVGHVRWFTR